jgi:uncharacterized protein YjbI with pentapeptide repeats
MENDRSLAEVLRALIDDAELGANNVAREIVINDLRKVTKKARQTKRERLRAVELLAGQASPLKPISLEGADLNEVSLRGADLGGSRLTRAQLRKADLTQADLSFSWLNEVDLRGTLLVAANLRAANLNDADLTGADLTDADIRLARLRNVRWSTETSWPDKSVASWVYSRSARLGRGRYIIRPVGMQVPAPVRN